MTLHIRRATPGDQPLMERVDNGLGQYNANAAPLQEVQSLAFVAESGDGRLLGGLLGRTWGACAEVQQLWVDEAARKTGVGTRLLAEFERAARATGVTTFYLDTWSFQARGFYERNGYRVALEISGMGPGITKYIMLKKPA